MYSKGFVNLARILVALASLAVVGVTVFGTISHLDPTLERTKQEIEHGRGFNIFGTFVSDVIICR